MNVPARLALGERLYRDVVYHYGPAGPWINALSIRLLGRKFAALEATGLVAAALLFYALFRLTRRAGSPLSACAAVTWAAALCVGAPNGGSFLFPYSFGTLFALAGAFTALSACAVPPPHAATLVGSAGVCLALAAKPEIGAACALVLLAAAVRWPGSREERKPLFRSVLLGVCAAAALYAVAFFGLPWRDLYPEGPFALFSPPEPWRAVYRVISGLATPEASLRTVATSLFIDLLILAAALALSRVARRPSGALEAAWLVAVIAAVAFFGLWPGVSVEVRLPPLLSPMPLVSAVAALIVLLRGPAGGAGRARWLLFGFSALVGARVLLGLQYGAITTPYSILAFPGLAATAAVLTVDLLAERSPDKRRARRFLAVLFFGFSAVALLRWQRYLAHGKVSVVTSAGSLRLHPDRAAAIAETLRFLESRARPGDTLSGFPEIGGFFNFVTGLRNPLREEQVLPGHLDPAAEERLIRSIEENGPRFILVANSPAPGFGAVFGTDYATGLWEEITRRYRVRASFGPAPPDAAIGSPDLFIRVFEKGAASP